MLMAAWVPKTAAPQPAQRNQVHCVLDTCQGSHAAINMDIQQHPGPSPVSFKLTASNKYCHLNPELFPRTLQETGGLHNLTSSSLHQKTRHATARLTGLGDQDKAMQPARQRQKMGNSLEMVCSSTQTLTGQ